MRSLLAASVLLGVVPLLQGCCCIGAVSRFDGEWPLPPTDLDRPHWDEAASGEGAVLLRKRGSATSLVVLTATRRRSIELERPLDLAGAQIEKNFVYRIGPEGVVRAPLFDPAKGETIARIESARSVAVAGDTLLVARPGAVLLVRGASSRAIWQGEALAIAVDLPRKAAWIVAREPLPVVDLVALEDGEVLCRVPLPEGLDGPNVRCTLSGGSAVVWAHDRPLEVALLLAPDVGGAWHLSETWAHPSSDAVASSFARDSTPPLLVPERSGPVAPERSTFGRVAPASGGRFIVASMNGDGGKATIASIGSAAWATSPPSRRTISTPEKWPGVVAGLVWSRDEVVIASDPERLLRVKASLEPALDTPVDVGGGFRHGFNYLFNVPVVATELAASVAGGVTLGCLVAPFAPLVMIVDPKVGILTLLAPVWFPFVKY